MSSGAPDFLNALEVEVTRQGGVRLPDSCVPVPMVIKYDHVAQGQPQKATTQGCREKSMFVVPYDDESATPVSEQGFVRFCAFCDSAYRWPRFKNLATII